MDDLQPMIDAVLRSSGSHVVVGICEEGVRLLCESEEACSVIQTVLGENFKVIPRDEFLLKMEELRLERQEVRA